MSQTATMIHRVGIIGLGTVGSRFVEQFGLHDAFEVVAAWDPDPDACDRHRDDVWVASDAAAVIEAAQVVYVAVPPLFHRGYVERCVESGVAVFCEKPLGIDVAESRDLVRLVEASGVPAGVNFVFGAAPSALELERRVEQGTIGPLIRGDLRMHFAQWPRAWHTKAQWLRRRDQGGWIREVVSHYLFLAARVLGPLTLEWASVDHPDGPDGTLCEIDAGARLMASGVPLVMLGTSEGVGPDELVFTVRGSNRSLRIVDWYRLQSTSGGEWDDVLGTDRSELAADAYASQLDELSKMLAGEPHRIATFAEALAVQELVEQMLS